jgi:hypothetical protein
MAAIVAVTSFLLHVRAGFTQRAQNAALGDAPVVQWTYGDATTNDEWRLVGVGGGYGTNQQWQLVPVPWRLRDSARGSCTTRSRRRGRCRPPSW